MRKSDWIRHLSDNICQSLNQRVMISCQSKKHGQLRRIQMSFICSSINYDQALFQTSLPTDEIVFVYVNKLKHVYIFSTCTCNKFQFIESLPTSLL